jgi:hypothetical protein
VNLASVALRLSCSLSATLHLFPTDQSAHAASLFHMYDVMLGTSSSFMKVRSEAHVRCRGGLGDQQVGQQKVGEQQMKRTAFLFLIFATAAYPAVAKPDHHNQRYQHAVGGNHAPEAYRSHQAHHARQAYRAQPTARQYQASRPSTNAGTHSNITCDMVRSYVAQVGLARAMAAAAGMTAAEERRARHGA